MLNQTEIICPSCASVQYFCKPLDEIQEFVCSDCNARVKHVHIFGEPSYFAIGGCGDQRRPIGDRPDLDPVHRDVARTLRRMRQRELASENEPVWSMAEYRASALTHARRGMWRGAALGLIAGIGASCALGTVLHLMGVLC